jgi:hypothetical protein
MNETVKKQWIKALTSGEYKQARESLHVKTLDGDSYCCLGVLCELAIKAGVDIEVREISETKIYGGYSGTIPNAVRDWADITPLGSLIKSVGEYTNLASLNDNAGYNFNQIAQVIEEQF